MNITRLSVRAAYIVIAASVCMPLGSCGETGVAATDPASDAAFGAAEQSYVVRGEITQMPADGPPPLDLKIHHEHIPEFIGGTGTIHDNGDGVMGMKSMIMPFPLVDPDIDLSAFGVGDKVRFTLEVKWNAGIPTYRISAIDPLPPETKLDYSNIVADTIAESAAASGVGATPGAAPHGTQPTDPEE